MSLRFVGVDPESPHDESPTVWVDEETGDLIIQSWVADEATIRQAQEAGSAPGHSTTVPPGETVIRLPARMRRFLSEAYEAGGVDRAATRA